LVLGGGSVAVVPSALFAVLLVPLDEALDRAALREVMPLSLVDLAPLSQLGPRRSGGPCGSWGPCASWGPRGSWSPCGSGPSVGGRPACWPVVRALYWHDRDSLVPSSLFLFQPVRAGRTKLIGSGLLKVRHMPRPKLRHLCALVGQREELHGGLNFMHAQLFEHPFIVDALPECDDNGVGSYLRDGVGDLAEALY
jgi:hypothetical protein